MDKWEGSRRILRSMIHITSWLQPSRILRWVSPYLSKSAQCWDVFFIDLKARKEPKGSLDLRSLSLCSSDLQGFLALLPLHSPEVGLRQSTVCRSLLLNDWTVARDPNDLPKYMTLLYFVTSVFREFDAMASPFSRSGTSSEVASV
jgi:hypothetical protein